jgi:hypothetical protein
MTRTLRLAALNLTILLAACSGGSPPPVDPGVAALSLPNGYIFDQELHAQPIPAGRPLKIYLAELPQLLDALHGLAPFAAELAVTAATAGSETTRVDYAVPEAQRGAARAIVALVVLDPGDLAYADYDLAGKTLAEVEGAMADRKIALGYAFGSSVFEPTTVLEGGRLYPFALTVLLPQLATPSDAWWDTSTGPAPDPHSGVVEDTSTNLKTIPIRTGYGLFNNQWNQSQLQGTLTTRVYLKDGGTFGWEWSSDRSNAVLAYPEVWTDGLAGLPMTAGAKRIQADFDIATSAVGDYDTSFDIWLSPTATRATSMDGLGEIMIWVDRKGTLFYPGGLIVDRVTIGGIAWDVYVNPQQHSFTTYTWAYMAFLPERPVTSGPLDISAFIDYALAAKLVPDTYWLTGIELGTEVVVGSGAVEVSGYDLTFTDPI